jgi:hypothetical protein
VGQTDSKKEGDQRGDDDEERTANPPPEAVSA